MSKFIQFLHGLGGTIQKAAASAGPEVTTQLGAVGSALHSIADLIEKQEASAYLGPVFGTIVGNMLNTGTDNLARDLEPAPAPPPPPPPLVGA